MEGFVVGAGPAVRLAVVGSMRTPSIPLEDARRLEVVVDGLPVLGGAQPAVDTTLVSALHGDEDQGGAPLTEMAWHSWRPGNARNIVTQSSLERCAGLVVLAVEVGGRFSRETSGPGWSETVLMRKRAEQAWRMRWCGLFGCAAAKAFAASLLEQRSMRVDGVTPASHEVEGDFVTTLHHSFSSSKKKASL